MTFPQPPMIEDELSDLYLYWDDGDWFESPHVPEALLNNWSSAQCIRGYLVEHVTGIPRWEGWRFRLVRHPKLGRIVKVTATPPESHTPKRDERRSRDRFVRMLTETQRWFEEFNEGRVQRRSMDVDWVTFLAMLLPSPYHGHDRAEAAETVAALCRFAAQLGLEWRPLLAAIYDVSDRTVDTWMSEAHAAGLEPLRRSDSPTTGDGQDHETATTPTGPHAGRTITLLFTPSRTSRPNDAGKPTHDVEITGTWSDGEPAEAFPPLPAATLAATVAEQLRLTNLLEQRYPGAKARATLGRPRTT